MSINLLDQMLQDGQAIMLVYSGEILGCDYFKEAIRAEIDERIAKAFRIHQASSPSDSMASSIAAQIEAGSDGPFRE